MTASGPAFWVMAGSGPPGIRTLLLLGLLWSGPLSAHAFDVAIYASYAGGAASEGEQLWKGMRVASGEQDGHPFETADGHLGGVDSNLLRVARSGSADRLNGVLDAMVQRQGVAILVLSPRDLAVVDRLAVGLPLVVVVAGQAPLLRNGLALHPVSGVSEAAAHRFNLRYRQQYGEPATRVAGSGYAAARLIADAVGILDGDFTGAKQLGMALDRASELGTR